MFSYNVRFRNMMKYFTKMAESGLYDGRFDTLETTRVYSFFSLLTNFSPNFLSFIIVQTHLEFIVKP